MAHGMVRVVGPTAGSMGGSITFAFVEWEGELTSDGAPLTHGDGRNDPTDSDSDSACGGSTGVRLVDT